MNCNACGSANVIEGRVSDSSGGGVESFHPNDKSFFKKILSIGGRKVRAYGCLHCSNLQFTVDFNEGDKKKYSEFASPPPSVTELSDD